MTLLCVPIMVQDVDSALSDAASAKLGGADLVEYRLDDFFSGEGMTDAGDSPETTQILNLVARSPLPCIVTCRPAGPEGGNYDGDDMARISLLERLGTAFGQGEEPPRYIDVEWSTISRSANIRQKVRLAVEHPEQVRDLRTSLIVSTHDFTGRPADLTRRLAAMSADDSARVLKIAFRARSIRDNLELFEIIRAADRPVIALGMGEFGLMSRVLAPKFGGFLTFASLRDSAATAPGQPTLRDMVDLYRFRSISAATRVFGVVGWPVGHSLSPRVHNAGFAAAGFDGVYLPLPVVGDVDGSGGYESLKATLLELLDHEPLGLMGLSVTIPHKEHLVRLAREQGWALDEHAATIGAANTLLREGRMIHVRNTDAPAVVQSIVNVTGEVEGRRAVVIGAGGAGRAAAYGLAKSGAIVTIANRTRARAEVIAHELAPIGPVTATGLDQIAAARPEVIVNCTPAGMLGGGREGDLPFPESSLGQLERNTVIMDTVYNPILTPLLGAARRFGYRTIDGVSMFTLQAEAQFRMFTGTSPPAGLFDRIVRDALSAPT